MKKTPWFDGSVKPVHFGVYERDLGEIGVLYSDWNGSNWGGYSVAIDGAIANQNYKSKFQNSKWRGIAKDGK